MKKYKLKVAVFRVNGKEAEPPEIWLMDKKETMFVYVNYVGVSLKGSVLRSSSKADLGQEISRLVKMALMKKGIISEKSQILIDDLY